MIMHHMINEATTFTNLYKSRLNVLLFSNFSIIVLIIVPTAGPSYNKIASNRLVRSENIL